MDNYLFDFDGTLADSGRTAELATQSAFKDFNLAEPSAELIDYYMGIPIEKSFKAMAPEYQFTATEFEALLQSFRDHYQKLEQDNVTLFPNVKTTLSDLVQADKKLFVVSSKHSKALQRNLELLNIDQYFTDIIGSDQVEHFKPAPDGILIMLKRHQLNPKKTVMIGDATHDIQMGQAAHIKTIAVTWGAHSLENLQAEHPDFVVHAFPELEEL